MDAAEIQVYTDTDWAGCLKTRNSTSGGCKLLGSHLLKSWSSTQQTVALSSGEAEYYGVVKGASIGLGTVAMLKDVGVQSALKVRTDSAAAQGIGGRHGLGKLRHIDTACLWIQDKIRRGAFNPSRIKGILNPADIFTKYTHTADQVQHVWLGWVVNMRMVELLPLLFSGMGCLVVLVVLALVILVVLVLVLNA